MSDHWWRMHGPPCPVCGKPLVQTPRVDVCDHCGHCDYYPDYYPDMSLPREAAEEPEDD